MWGRSVVAGLALLSAGCSAEETLAVRRWHLAGAGAVTLPADVHERVASRGGTVTLHTVVEIPPSLRARDLSLSIPVRWSSPRLSIEGEPIDDVARSLFQKERSGGAHLYRIPARLTARSSLPLQLDVVDTYAFCTTFMSVPALAVGDRGSRAYRAAAWFNEVALIQYNSTGGSVVTG